MVIDTNYQTSESIELARMRTLLALERNYLAEERTCLAEFRTGLALTLIGPPSGIAIFSSMSIEDASNWLLLILYGFIFMAVCWGIFMVIKSARKLSKLRKERQIVQKKEMDIITQSEEVRELLSDCILAE